MRRFLSERDRPQGVDDAVAVEAVELGRALALVDPGPAVRHAVDLARRRAGGLGRGPEQDALGLDRVQREAALVLAVLGAVLADDERDDAGRVRRGHRGALDPLVVRAGRAVAVL